MHSKHEFAGKNDPQEKTNRLNEDSPPPLRQKMVCWYSPLRLISIAIRVAISTIFGEFADRREMLAMTRRISLKDVDSANDYSEASGLDFWFDFAADTGDGWSPTYAIARLLARPELAVDGLEETLPRGAVLVFGGDEVYPTPSREEYRARIKAPFEEAARVEIDEENRRELEKHRPHVYAIPGNHDWYDGLLSFLGLFCRRRNKDPWVEGRSGREFGERETQQTRSYFAVKLPHNWWLWGADIQLSGYVDQPQIDFFSCVAKKWMKKDSRLILCTGQPSWAYVDKNNPEPAFMNFSYLESIADSAKKGHRLCAVLTGDSHHYVRFSESGRSYITAGGGGAFLHPTHHLKEERFAWKYPPPGIPYEKGKRYERNFEFARGADEKPAIFPDRKTSFLLSFRNLAFAALNWQYTVFIAGLYVFFTWLLQAQAVYLHPDASLNVILASQPTFFGAVRAFIEVATVSPWPATLFMISLAGYYYLADYPKPWRLVAGTLHGVAQGVLLLMTICVLGRWLPETWTWRLNISVGLIGGVLSATLLGLYFLISLSLFGKHWNEAFSALRIEDYKCFLRMRIGTNGDLTIFPIGLKNVPREPRSGLLRNPPLRPHLIEKPVVIR